MERFNSEGILRADLSIALKDRKKVRECRRIDRCMLCRRSGVNEAGLCVVCYSMLDGEELNLACRWISGVEP